MIIAHYEHGRSDPDSVPVIFSSSLGTTSEMWTPQTEALSETFRVITFDHRGHGKSAVPAGPYTLAELGADVIGLMDTLSIEKANFVGLSLGGMVGMWLGVNAPERIEKLALLCTFAEVNSPELWHDRASVARGAGTEALVEASIERWFTTGFRDSNPQTVKGFRRMLAAVPDEGYAGCCEAIATMAIAEALGVITAPTLVVSGSHDISATVEMGKRLAASIPGAHFTEVPAAHLANVEASVVVNRLLHDYLA
jgi:3-oxoadipate enol-lactonase